jgi:hypothetical protein
VLCKVGDGGKVSLFANAGDLDVIADVVGCFTKSGAGQVPLGPTRMLDTRSGLGAPKARVGAGGEVALAVGGQSGIPTNAQAVVLNVTAVGTPANTFITVYPNGADRPEASSLNVTAGQTASNLVLAKVGTGGVVRLYNHSGSVDLVADVTGYFL